LKQKKKGGRPATAKSTRSLRRRAALVIRPANNNHSGRSLLPFVSARPSLSFSLALLAYLRSGRCIATRTVLSLYPVRHEEEEEEEEARQSRACTIGPSGPRMVGMPRTERGRNRRAKRKEIYGAARRTTERVWDDRCHKGRRRTTRSERMKKVREREREREGRGTEKRKYRREENEGSEREV